MVDVAIAAEYFAERGFSRSRGFPLLKDPRFTGRMTCDKDGTAVAIFEHGFLKTGISRKKLDQRRSECNNQLWTQQTTLTTLQSSSAMSL
jgi:hypothetical protein